jgi:hypothetical protein
MKKNLIITVLTASAVFVSMAFARASAAKDVSTTLKDAVIYVIPSNDDDDDDVKFEAYNQPFEAQTHDEGPQLEAAPSTVEYQPIDKGPDVEAYPGVYGTPSTLGGDDDTPDFVMPEGSIRNPADIDVSIPDSDTDSDEDTDTDGGLEVGDTDEPTIIIHDRYRERRPDLADIPRIPDSIPDPDTDTDTDTTGDMDRPGSTDRTGGTASGGACPDRPCCRTNCIAAAEPQSDYAEIPDVIETTADWMAYQGNGGCSLTPSSGASNVIPILIFALSLVPIAMRRANWSRSKSYGILLRD